MTTPGELEAAFAEEADRIDHEIDLVFIFGKEIHACSPNSAASVELLGMTTRGDQILQFPDPHVDAGRGQNQRVQGGCIPAFTEQCGSANHHVDTSLLKQSGHACEQGACIC